MLQRFPGGIGKDGFYQKDAGKTVPRWIRRVRARKEGGTVDHPVVDDEAALLALSNLGTISFHRWGSRADELEQPDLLIIDLDPTAADVAAVVQAARWTRELLDELDLAAYVQATGSRGLHVVTPLDRSASTEEVGAFADGLAMVLAARHPDELTAAFHKADRGDRLYLDTARNGYAQTAVAPYSVRPRAAGAGRHAARVGRARRPRVPPRRLDDRRHPDPARRTGGPVGVDAPPRPLAGRPPRSVGGAGRAARGADRRAQPYGARRGRRGRGCGGGRRARR